MQIEKKLQILLLLLPLASCLSSDPVFEQPGFRKNMPAMPVVYQSSMSNSLRCLGRVIDKNYSGAPVVFSIVESLDGTRPATALQSIISQAGDFMINTAFAKIDSPNVRTCMNRLNCSFDFYLQNGFGLVFVNSAVTEYDFTAQNPAKGWGFQLGPFEYTNTKDNTWDAMAIDVNLMNHTGENLQNGSFRAQMKDDNMRTSIDISGGIFAFDYSFQEKEVQRRHTQQRLMMEAGIFHLLSRYFKVDGLPEQKVCSMLPSVAKGDSASALNYLARQNDMVKIALYQTLLKYFGFYEAEIDGTASIELIQAAEDWGDLIGMKVDRNAPFTEELYLSLLQFYPEEKKPVRPDF